MRILILNGSPNAEKGNTHVMVEQFSKGAKEAGAEVENIFLAKKKINTCLGCTSCWDKTLGKCVQQDDMQNILVKAKNSDLIIFATPLYVHNVSGVMKNAMDRMLPLYDPLVTVDENNESRHMYFTGNATKIGIISNCSFAEQSQFTVLRLLFRRIARNMDAELAVEIYRGEGVLLKRDAKILKPIIDGYKELLIEAGKEVVSNGMLSEKSSKMLEKPFISYERYIEAHNKHIEARK